MDDLEVNTDRRPDFNPDGEARMQL